jgi:hypothetical protein
VLTVVLTVWLTATTALAPCCWSISYAQSDAAPQTASAIQSHHHHHHHAAAAGIDGTLTVTAIPSHDCDRDSADAIASARGISSFDDMKAAGAVTARGLVIRPMAAMGIRHFDLAPPGGPPPSAFLNPLRV